MKAKTKAQLQDELIAMTARAEAAEAAQGPALRADPGTRPAPAGPSAVSRFIRWFRRLALAEQIAFGVLMLGSVVLLAIVADVTIEWLRAKAGHAIAVIAYGIIGAFVGVLIAWLLNKVRFIRERAVPTADDSLNAIEEWRQLRRKKPDAAWTPADAQTTLASCLRFGMSYLGIIILAATGMIMAT